MRPTLATEVIKAGVRIAWNICGSTVTSWLGNWAQLEQQAINNGTLIASPPPVNGLCSSG